MVAQVQEFRILNVRQLNYEHKQVLDLHSILLDGKIKQSKDCNNMLNFIVWLCSFCGLAEVKMVLQMPISLRNYVLKWANFLSL